MLVVCLFFFVLVLGVVHCGQGTERDLSKHKGLIAIVSSCWLGGLAGLALFVCFVSLVSRLFLSKGFVLD